MAINNAVGSIAHNNLNIAEIVNSANSSIQGIIGSVKFSIGKGMPKKGGADFSGMDANNITYFDSAIDKYRDEIQAIIDGFNAEADMNASLKGEVATATHEFLLAIKALLDKYVAAINIEKKEIDEANQNYLAAAGAISGNIVSDSDSIRSQANGLSLD